MTDRPVSAKAIDEREKEAAEGKKAKAKAKADALCGRGVSLPNSTCAFSDVDTSSEEEVEPASLTRRSRRFLEEEEPSPRLAE